MLFHILACLAVTVSAVSVHDERHTTDNGTATESASGRIAGGWEAESSKCRHQVQVLSHGIKFCSGNIINRRYVLTAANCVNDASPNNVEVRRGSRRRRQGIVIPISEIRVHPSYNYPRHHNDIAYLKTSYPMKLNNLHESVYLPPVNTNLPSHVQVSGWGLQKMNDAPSETLNQVELQIINNTHCQRWYKHEAITNNMFCAKHIRTDSKGACEGDEGSPAILTGSQGMVGIITLTKGCGRGMAPSVFTNLLRQEVHDFITYGTFISDEEE